VNGTRTALAFSGGGHRATAFALGVLLYLADAGRANDIVSIASVSGGSLANGAVAQDVDLRTCSKGEIEAVVTRVASRVASTGTLLRATVTRLYFVWLLVLPAVVACAWGFVAFSVGTRIGISAVALVLFVFSVGQRGVVCGRAFAETLFSTGGRSAQLGDIHQGVDHVICATELHAGEHMYFSGRFVSSYRFGLGRPGNLPLHVAVQASAAFPPIFPPRRVRSARFSFKGGRPEAAGTKFLELHDGGVYDNMADQWMQGLVKRAARPENADAAFKDADALVAVNSSAGLGWSALRLLRIPVLRELVALLQDKSVLYDNGTALRRVGLVARFDLAEREGHGLTGALVHIAQTPFTVPDGFADEEGQWKERSERARQVLAHLAAGSLSRADWSDVAKENSVVPTTLVRLGDAVTSRLMFHAYVLAMVNLHVVLDYPLLELPSRERFTALLKASTTCE